MSRSPRKRALLIGINYLTSANRLQGCKNDVLNMQRVLLEQCAYAPENILLLTDDAPASVQQVPTRARMLESFDWLLRDALAGDTLFVEYSGHGTGIRDVNGDEQDQQDECLVPVDYETAGLIVDDQLRTLVADRVPAGVSLLAVFDSCNSGSAVDLRFNYTTSRRRRARQWTVTHTLVEQQRYAPTLGRVAFLSGCSDAQTSADAAFDGRAQGALTHALLQVLGAHQNRPVYAALVDEVRAALRAGGFAQTPCLSLGRAADVLTDRFAL